MQLPTTPPGPPGQPDSFGPERTPYEALGGETALRRLIDTFYDHMDRDEQFKAIRVLHPADLTQSRQKLFMFLSGWLGGPGLYIEAYGHPRLRARHGPFPIGTTEANQWLACMGRAMDDCTVTGELRAFLEQRLTHVAMFMRNRTDG